MNLKLGRDWKTVRLIDLVTDGPSNGYSGPVASEALGTPTLRLSATSSGTCLLNDSTTKRLVETISRESDLWLKPGDLLVQRSNTPDLVGTAAIFDGPPATYVYPDLMMRMRFSELSTAKWVWRYMNSNWGRQFFHRVAAGSSGSMPKISGVKIREMMIPLPPLPEQQRIAKILDAADALRARRRAALAEVDALTQSIFFEMFGDPVQNPNGWPAVQLGDAIHSASDGPHVSPNYTETGVPFLSTRHVRVGKIAWEDLKFVSQADAEVHWRKCRPERGDVLYTKGGTTGLAAAVLTDEPFAIWVHVALLKVRRERTDSIWLESMLNSAHCYRQSQALTRGIANRDLGLTRMVNIEMFLPPLPLQQTFARRIAAVETLKTAHRASLAELDALFASLQHRAFRGEL